MKSMLNILLCLCFINIFLLLLETLKEKLLLKDNEHTEKEKRMKEEFALQEENIKEESSQQLLIVTVISVVLLLIITLGFVVAYIMKSTGIFICYSYLSH